MLRPQAYQREDVAAFRQGTTEKHPALKAVSPLHAEVLIGRSHRLVRVPPAQGRRPLSHPVDEQTLLTLRYGRTRRLSQLERHRRVRHVRPFLCFRRVEDVAHGDSTGH